MWKSVSATPFNQTKLVLPAHFRAASKKDTASIGSKPQTNLKLKARGCKSIDAVIFMILQTACIYLLFSMFRQIIIDLFPVRPVHANSERMFFFAKKKINRCTDLMESGWSWS